jgi:hypothetical protein
MTHDIEVVSRSKAIAPTDTHLILGLRLLIARAANRDSLAWWDDEALTAPAGFLLERLFPVAPPLAARSLALRAAFARHEGACTDIGGVLHLYRLDADNADGLALRNVPLLPVPYPEAPITRTDALREHLIALLGQPVQVKIVQRRNGGAMQIAIPPCPAGVWASLHRAKSFAWAYLEGAPGQPVFPFVAE